jgi:hypothetical protein
MTTPVTDAASNTVPLWLQSLDAATPIRVPAEHARVEMGALLTPDPAGGQNPLTGLLPSLAGTFGEVTAGAGGALTVAPFCAVLPGKVGGQGSYTSCLRNARTLTPTLPGAGQFRGVRVLAEIRDAVYDSGTHYDMHVFLAQGDPAATVNAVVQPAVPAGTLLLRTVTVDSAGVVTPVDVLAQRTVALGGIRPADVGDTVRGAYAGQWRDRFRTAARTTGVLERWNGTGWVAPLVSFLGTWGSLPTVAADGIQQGDVIYSSLYGCHLVYDIVTLDGSPSWHQIGSPVQISSSTGTALVAAGGIRGYVADRRAAGVNSWHNGFLVFDNTLDRLYASTGTTADPAFRLVGGAQAAAVTNVGLLTVPNGTLNSDGNWAPGSLSFRTLGNGMAKAEAWATRTTSAFTVPATGDINNTGVAKLPPAPYDAWYPTENVPLVQAGHLSGGGRLIGGYLSSAGYFVISAVAPGANVAVGDALAFSATYMMSDPLVSGVP